MQLYISVMHGRSSIPSWPVMGGGVKDWLSAVGFDDGSSSEMPTIFENIRLAP
jgi:hypothetical protein